MEKIRFVCRCGAQYRDPLDLLEHVMMLHKAR